MRLNTATLQFQDLLTIIRRHLRRHNSARPDFSCICIWRKFSTFTRYFLCFAM